MRDGLKPTRDARRGFAWIEVLIMSTILLFVLVGSASVMTDGMASLRLNKTEVIARAAAIGEMERLKAAGWAVIGAKPLYPTASTAFCTNAAGGAIVGCVTGLETIVQETGATGQVYVQNYDANNNGAINLPGEALIRLVTVDVSVFGNINVLAQGGQPGSGTLRSVWRISSIVSQNGVTP